MDGRLAKGIGTRTAAVIVEPDALASGCVKTSLVKYAVTKLAKLGHTGVYIDAGHSNWQPAATMRRRLRAAAVSRADGIALNVSNYRRNDELIAYAKQIGRYHYVLDTSRNGQGRYSGDQDWCNPPGRGLGRAADDHHQHAGPRRIPVDQDPGRVRRRMPRRPARRSVVREPQPS